MQNTPENVFGQNTVANPQNKTISNINTTESDIKESTLRKLLWITLIFFYKLLRVRARVRLNHSHKLIHHNNKIEQEIRKKSYLKLSLISKRETVKYLFCVTRKYKTF